MRALVLGILVSGSALLGACTTPGRVYATPDAAGDALVAAVSPINEPAVQQALGSKGLQLLREGDDADAQANADRFVEAYRAKHEFVQEDDGSMTLEVGPDGWPLPIPLVRDGAGWRWDAAAGEAEIVARRVGRNELDAIQACLAIVDAQREYAAMGAGGAPGVFADRFISQPGTRNGLYWPTAENEAPSPLGPALAEATPEQLAAAAAGGVARSFHGYLFQMLGSQSAMAPGGAMNYEQDGRLTGGFAAVAYPAEYGRTGVMTFMVSNSGVVFQRDLGSNTASIARRMKVFDPSPEWSVVPLDQE